MAALKYRPAIDGLRAIAVLSVLIFHLNHQWLPGGFIGVDVFFVISGYLITSIILNDCEKGEFCLIKFYQRRIARIFPASFMVAFATLVGVSFIYSPQDYASAGANFLSAALSVANMKFMLQGNYFEISPDAQPFLHYWSLSVEEQFYLFFPLFFLLLFRYGRRYLVLVLSIVGLLSLLACLVVTVSKPVWAFFLLPTRAWELCAGALLAVLSSRSSQFWNSSRLPWLPSVGLMLVGVSCLIIPESPHFPGWLATLPVLGTVFMLLPSDAGDGKIEKWLSAPPLVKIGRISYSVYLWHWPVFSLVDYQLYLAPELLRVCLKIGFSFLLAFLSFLFVENPGRVFLNHRRSRPIAYIGLMAVLGISVPIGVLVRRNNYVNAELSDVAKGGIVFSGKPGGRSIVLMGDSTGSMYGKVMKEICEDLGYKLTVISVAAGDPLPSSDGKDSQLWIDSLAVVEHEKPDVLVMACRWEYVLKNDRSRLALALKQLQSHATRIFVLTQPPILPGNANRSSIRGGQRPPFMEDEATRDIRIFSNSFLMDCRSNKIEVLDIAANFQGQTGEVRFLDQYKRQLYHDSIHLSGYGANLIRPLIQTALQGNTN
jgi:peptidoglycan/LPS O-acetylase OafA/YrhL